MATFRTRKNADGNTAYHVQVRLKGHPPQTATFQRLTDARRWAQRTEANIREGRHFPGTAAKRHTLSETIDRYLDTVLPHKGENTVRTQTIQLTWWAKQIGHMRLCDVTPPVMAEQRDLLGQSHKPSSVNQYLVALSHVFTTAVREWQWTDSNPLQNVNKPRNNNLRIRFLSEDERRRLLDACKRSNHPFLHLIVVLALSTGARKTELLTLRWKDIDLGRGMFTLHDTKNKERRSLPITGFAHGLMQEHAKVRRIDTEFVFPGPDGQPTNIERNWQTARKAAQIENFRFHDLRHTCASYLAMNGASLAEIAEVLGHKSLGMVKRYAHLSEAHTAGVVTRMNQAIFGE